MKQPSIRQYIPVSLKNRPTLSNLVQNMKTKCEAEASNYAACVQKQGINIQEHECQESFQRLVLCLKRK